MAALLSAELRRLSWQRLHLASAFYSYSIARLSSFEHSKEAVSAFSSLTLIIIKSTELVLELESFNPDLNHRGF